jgi:hypothetical protein
MSEFLFPNELHQLTGYARASGQAEWLKAKGIPHRDEGGRIIVSREHVRSWIEGKPVLARGGLNVSAIR